MSVCACVCVLLLLLLLLCSFPPFKASCPDCSGTAFLKLPEPSQLPLVNRFINSSLFVYLGYPLYPLKWNPHKNPKVSSSGVNMNRLPLIPCIPKPPKTPSGDWFAAFSICSVTQELKKLQPELPHHCHSHQIPPAASGKFDYVRQGETEKNLGDVASILLRAQMARTEAGGSRKESVTPASY